MKLDLPTIPEPTNAEYSCYNTGSVEIEVADFLYGFVRMIKPEAVLETGTYKGISASYIASALKDNNKGILTTIEFEPIHFREANELFKSLGLEKHILSLCQDVKNFQVAENQYDFMFLDTEPHLRFDELIRFWDGLKPGGFVGIHDLNANMGQTGTEINGIMDWPFGTLPEEMKKILKEELQSFHFPTPRGFWLAQRKKEGFYEL